MAYFVVSNVIIIYIWINSIQTDRILTDSNTAMIYLIDYRSKIKKMDFVDRKKIRIDYRKIKMKRNRKDVQERNQVDILNSIAITNFYRIILYDDDISDKISI